MKPESFMLGLVVVVFLALIVLAFLPRKSQRPPYQEQPTIEQVDMKTKFDTWCNANPTQCKG